MSGHSKWHNIKHKKAISDSKKSKVYAKISKLIEIASRGWSDPSMNPALETVLIKAKSNSLPKEIIEKAIKKWAWGWLEWELQEIYYEWYGPSGSALYIKCITNNTNRSASNIKALISKYWGSLWIPWSVARQFKELGVISIDGITKSIINKWNIEKQILPFDFNTLEIDALEYDIINIWLEEDIATILTAKEQFLTIIKELESKWYHIADANLEFIPNNKINLNESDIIKFEKIIEIIEEDDDVDEVYHNVD
jgi:YebC/PmpR family DNA-binding regulatory protein